MERLFVGIITFFSSIAMAKDISVLKHTETYNKGSAFVTELVFDGPVEVNKTSVEYINQTIQLNIRGVSVNTGKELKRVEDPKVKSIYTYQIEPDLMRTRVIYKKPVEAKDLEGYVHLTAKGQTLIVTIEDPSAVVSSNVKKQFPIIPPVDLNAELEPKVTKIDGAPDLEASATALLEKEFLKTTSKGKIKKISVASKDTDKALAKEAIESPVKDLAGLEESEIPLNLGEVKEGKSDISPWNRMIISLIVISIVGIAMIVVAKRYSKAKAGPSGNINIKVISQQSIGPKKNLTVVRVAGEDILIGVTDYNISMIKSLSFIDDEIESDVPQDFVEELNKVTDRYVDRRVTARGRAATTVANSTVPEDDFSMGNIKDMISTKLKEMRPL